MCGIYLKNFIEPKEFHYSNFQKINILRDIADTSARRGSDSSGIFLIFSEEGKDPVSYLLRTPDSPNVLFKSLELKKLIKKETKLNRKLLLGFGHTRMNTDGKSYDLGNNQPLFEDNKLLVFNGIITNATDLGTRHDENDGYAILRNIGTKNDSFFLNATGMINFITFDMGEGELLFYTNNGSLYADNLKNPSIVTSEPTFHSAANKQFPLNKEHRISLNELISNTITEVIEVSPKNDPVIVSNVNYSFNYPKLEEAFNRHEDKVKQIDRCSNCLLPITHPFLVLDENSICNFCNNHESMALSDISDFNSFIDSAKKGNLLIGLSGGRDSCASLHELVTAYGIKPITYTYDWGVNTNLARRNVSRMCGELGVENVLIAADIRLKRRNVKLNLSAWLKDPHPGLIPLLMAGDKQFISNAAILKKERKIDHEMFGFNLHEKTQFKEEFSGVRMWSDDISGKYGEDLGIIAQLKMIMFYIKRGILNPSLINISLPDTARGFLNYYHSNVNVTQFYQYHDWDENNINNLLSSRYGWEFAKDTPTSWRIGDGTASFYNLAYFLLAGFTENDVIRSNLIREGKLTREEGLELIYAENRPRFPTLKWYCDILDIEFEPFINLTFKKCIENTLVR